MAYDPTKNAGAGLEDLDATSKMPLLNIIQQMSPQLVEDEDKYIDGAKAGSVFFSPTGKLIKLPTEIVPVAFRTMYVEWKPKTLGGGMVGMHPLSIQGRKDLGYEQGRKGQYDEWLGEHELKKTTYVMGIADIDGEKTDVMLALSVTGQKVSRKWQDEIRKFRYDGALADIPPAIFARAFQLSTVRETNSQDQSYYNWKVSDPRVLDFTADEALLELADKKYAEAQESLPSPQATGASQLAIADADVPF